MNRLATSGSLSYDTDRNANRWHQNPVGQGAQLGFDIATNRIASGNGVSYDAAGNIINDGAHSYVYDAEGRIVSADSGSIQYVYDVYGRRVRKVVSGSTPVEFIYDVNGRVLMHQQDPVWIRGDLWAGNRHLGSYWNGTTYFSHTDWQGSERMRSDVNGNSFQTWKSNP